MFFQGVLILLFGIIVLVNPEITLKVLTRLLGVFLLVAGVILFFSNYDRKNINKSNSVLLFMALIYFGLGLLFVLFPSLVASVFIIILGIIAIAGALTNLWFHFKSRSPLAGMAIARNLLIFLFGLFMLIRPVKGQTAIAVVIGVFALLFGAVLIINAYRLHALKRSGNKDL